MNALRSPTLTSHLWKELAMHLRNSGSTLTLEQAATVAIRAWIVANPPQSQGSASASASELPAASGPTPVEPPSGEGYQWKTLFLPSGTDLRMSTRDGTGHARVCGDDIIYNGRRVSPRGLTLAIAGDGRNAWRDLWLRMPGEIDFRQACRCRLEHERMAAGRPVHPYMPYDVSQMLKQRCAETGNPPSPAPVVLDAEQDPQHARAVTSPTPEPTVAAAAVAMSEALTTMLALMERLNAGATPGPMHDSERRVKPGRREEDILADHCAFD